MVTRLRTLTEKSKFKFGKYSEITVGELLNRGNREYIHWVYFNSSNITFTDEILDKVGLYRNRIAKPGKAPELFVGVIVKCKNTIGYIKRQSHLNKERKTSKKNHQISREKIWFNRSANAWKNQGH